jgi:hypothetical protein
MADQSPNPSEKQTDEQPSSTPRWVKAFAIIALILALLLAVSLLTGRGNHGPGRHLPTSSVEHRVQWA